MARMTVTALTVQLDRLMNRSFTNVSVEGEIAQLQVPSSGHAYLVLKDGDAVLQCVVWKSEWQQHYKPPKAGERVVAHGRIGAYPSQGRYQLYATKVEPAGEGDLEKKLAAIRERLRADGLLDPRRKRPLPAYPRVVGLATSLTGAALQDFLRVSRERWPAARILVSPCTVQGAEAAASVIRALELLFEDGRADVIVVTRGGGSRLDLMPFQDEQLARWIATAPVPIVSAVGHEIDSPLTDEVADAIAATPSAAVVRVLPDGPSLTLRVDDALIALESTIERTIRSRRVRLAELRGRLRHPGRAMREYRKRLEELRRRLEAAMNLRLERARARMSLVDGKLQTLSPYDVLGRGYAIVRGPEGVVREPGAVSDGDPLQIRVAGGTFEATVVSPPPVR